jgi:RNA polymerase sigma factor (sigma-70 family)
VVTSPVIKVVEHLRKTMRLREEDHLTDGQLLTRFVDNRDDAAFAALVRRHGPMVWGVCQRIAGRDSAEDAFQATFLILVRKAGAVKAREAVGNWLYGVASHAALKARTASARVRAKEKQVTSMPDPAKDQRDDREELQKLLDHELGALPDKYRMPVVLCDLEGRTRKEVAVQLKIPEGTLSSRLTTAHQMLAKRLARHGLAVSGASLVGLLAQNAASASVPAAVVSSTIKTATLVAASKAAVAGVVSTKVAALTEGVMKAMLLTKLKAVMIAMLVLGMIALGGGLLTYHHSAAAQPGRAANPMDEKDVEGKTRKGEGDGKDRKASQPAKPKEADTDTDRFQGSWTLVSEEQDGKPQPAPEQKKIYTFAGDKLRLTIEGGDLPEPITDKSGFRLSPTKKPKEIDGLADAKTGMKGIYLLDGDTLKICIALPGKDRPTEFLSRQGNCLMTLQRVAKPKEPKELRNLPAPKGKAQKADDVIQVDVTTGMFGGYGGKIPDLTLYAYLMFDGKIVGLDFSKNQAVQKQMRDWYGDPPAEPGSTAIAARKVQVKGRLEFRRGVTLFAGAGDGQKGAADGLVIVVESLTDLSAQK